MLGVCNSELRYRIILSQSVRSKAHFRAALVILIGLNSKNYTYDSKTSLEFSFDVAKLPTSSEPSAQSKSPSHQNLEETQSPLAQRKSFNVQVCGSGDRNNSIGLFRYMQLRFRIYITYNMRLALIIKKWLQLTNCLGIWKKCFMKHLKYII